MTMNIDTMNLGRGVNLGRGGVFRRLWLALVLMIAVVAFPAQAQQQNLSPKQAAAIEELTNAFQIGNGDIQSLLTLRQTFDNIINTAALKSLSEDDTLPEWGSADGPLVVEFSDYQCGYCKRLFASLQKTNARVRMVEFPILGELSVKATRYALAAQKQNRYAEFHVLLMKEQRLTEEFLQTAAVAAGLDMEKLQADIKSEEIEAKIRSNHQLAQTLNIRGTPFMLIDGKTYRGIVSEEVLKKLLSN